VPADAAIVPLGTNQNRKKSAIIGIFKGTVAVAYRGCTISALKPEWVAAESRMRPTMLLQ
jgi:hypothetical protein